MTGVRGLGHVNLRAPAALVERLRRFYIDIVGLREGARPAFRSGSHGYWLYAGDAAVLHLSIDAGGIGAPAHTGPFDHVAFDCTGLDAVRARLDAAGVRYRIDIVDERDQVQLFLTDPAGIGVELTFDARDHGRDRFDDPMAAATLLVATLGEALAADPSAALCVAFSGGGDSSALLHALAGLPAARARGLRAAHVDHRLHADSARWAAHCRDFCASLQVPLTVTAVTVARDRGHGVEAAAREARYAALAEILGAGETLVLAHHRDDQAETVLLKLLRGAGPEGLGGMRERRPLGAGWLWRPLLELPRSALRAHARAHALGCIEDPSNASPELARSFLRTRILPPLREHWPQADRVLAHAARLNRCASDYLDMQSRAALGALRGEADATLDAGGWLGLHEALRAPVLERWLRGRGLPPPNMAQRAELERQARDAAADRVPRVAWPGAEVRLWRGRLHAFAPAPPPPPGWRATWHGEALELPGGGRLQWTPLPTAGDALPAIDVRLGESGVRLRPAGDRHTRELRDLFQRAGVPPWRRPRCPLLYDAAGTLLAVADLYRTQAGDALFSACARHPAWTCAD
ncbi:MAG TPA: tRNA lysidine(34) synthetase TilS [Rhodanobacteraceae bacterium]|nr:tRNA lysidine(34) synthetase TilS [Rhodanobacteraceae bacterium]